MEAGGDRFPLAQMCHLWVIPKPGVELPAGRVRVVSVINGHVDAWEVTLPRDQPAGDDPQSPMVPIRNMRLLTASEAA